MVEIGRILCAVDFSDTSRRALEHATAVANWYGSRITALHVIHQVPAPQASTLFTGFAPEIAVFSESDRQLVAQHLGLFVTPATRSGVGVDILVDEGNPAGCILDHARSLQADVIVMGTHGVGGFERLVLGSVAEKVLRKATCPVLTVPPATTTTAEVPYTRLLCPVDFSDSSLTAVRFACSIAEESDAKLTLLHVIDWHPDEQLFIERFESPETSRPLELQAYEQLEALVTDEMRVWCQPSTRVVTGRPYRQILQLAEEEQSDLIVIGVRGRGALDLALFGSTTNQVVRAAVCPVLTLKA